MKLNDSDIFEELYQTAEPLCPVMDCRRTLRREAPGEAKIKFHCPQHGFVVQQWKPSGHFTNANDRTPAVFKCYTEGCNKTLTKMSNGHNVVLHCEDHGILWSRPFNSPDGDFKRTQ